MPVNSSVIRIDEAALFVVLEPVSDDSSGPFVTASFRINGDVVVVVVVVEVNADGDVPFSSMFIIPITVVVDVDVDVDVPSSPSFFSSSHPQLFEPFDI